jgi:hypothetical protein
VKNSRSSNMLCTICSITQTRPRDAVYHKKDSCWIWRAKGDLLRDLRSLGILDSDIKLLLATSWNITKSVATQRIPACYISWLTVDYPNLTRIQVHKTPDIYVGGGCRYKTPLSAALHNANENVFRAILNHWTIYPPKLMVRQTLPTNLLFKSTLKHWNFCGSIGSTLPRVASRSCSPTLFNATIGHQSVVFSGFSLLTSIT